MTIAAKLKELGIELPAASTPAGAYVPYVQTGNLVFLSGHLPRKDGKIVTGKLGAGTTTADGARAARQAAIDLIGTLNVATGGNLERVRRIVRVTGLVNSTLDYADHHLVINGCSELLGEVFGTQGSHCRSAYGVAAIPLGACVEIELIAEID